MQRPNIPKEQTVIVPLRSDGLTQAEFFKLKHLIARNRTHHQAAALKQFCSTLTVALLLGFAFFHLFDPYKLLDKQREILLRAAIFSAIGTAATATHQERTKRLITRQFHEAIDVEARKGLTEIKTGRSQDFETYGL